MGITDKNDEELLEKYGWTVECYSPFEISTKDGSFARDEAAQYVLDCIRMEDADAIENQLPVINDIDNYQENLFHNIVNMKHRIQGLASFVQNDFNEMLEDGKITKEDIKIEIEEMDKSFDKTINEMNIFREKCRMMMSHYCD